MRINFYYGTVYTQWAQFRTFNIQNLFKYSVNNILQVLIKTKNLVQISEFKTITILTILPT